MFIVVVAVAVVIAISYVYITFMCNNVRGGAEKGGELEEENTLNSLLNIY